MVWPFVLQFSSFPFQFRFVVPSDGCPPCWGRFRWPWGIFIFLQCSSFGEVDFIDLETRFWFPFLMGALVNEVDFSDLEAWIYFLQCTSFGGVDLFDPESRIYFLQCSSFSGVDFIDPEAPVSFLQWITLWRLDSGLIGFLFADDTLKNFLVGHKRLSFPCWKVSSFKSSLVRVFAWLGRRLRKGPSPGARLSSWPKWSPFGLRIVVSPLVWLEIAILFSPSNGLCPVHHGARVDANKIY